MFLKLQKKITAKLQNHYVAVHSGTLYLFLMFSDSLKITRQGRFLALLIFIGSQLSFVPALKESFKKQGRLTYWSITTSGSVFDAHVIYIGLCEMTIWVKVPATKPKDLNSIPLWLVW